MTADEARLNALKKYEEDYRSSVRLMENAVELVSHSGEQMAWGLVPTSVARSVKAAMEAKGFHTLVSTEIDKLTGEESKDSIITVEW